MLKVDQYGYIRIAHRVYGKSVRQISKETGHSRNTIKKVLRGEYCGYRSRTSQPYPVLGPYVNIHQQVVTDNKTQPKKQRHTAIRIYRRLKQEHGFLRWRDDGQKACEGSQAQARIMRRSLSSL